MILAMFLGSFMAALAFLLIIYGGDDRGEK